jgi:hypothetical protein
MLSLSVLSMESDAPPPRRSTRASHPSVSLADEQAAEVLSQLEQRDVAAALRSSLASSWECDEEDDDAVAEEEADEEAEEEKEKKEEAEPEEEKDGWSKELHDIDVPLPRLRHLQNRPPPADATPMQLLQLFLPQQLMEEFAQHTNAAAPHDWRHTTAAELYVFLGVHIYMGIDRLQQTEMYWSQTFSHPFVTRLFSRDRFKQLLRYFRVVPAPVAAAPRHPIPHVRALAEKLNASFAAHFTPTEHLTLDEAMCAWKGRSPIKQYIPSKPHKWGYKIYCLASENYLLHFEIYEGKEEEASEQGATYDTVIRMVQPYQDRQLTLFTDNWFTSPTLLLALQQRAIRICGAVNRRRKGMPAIPGAAIDALGRGQWLQRQKGDMTVAVWKDQRMVWVLYNHCAPHEASSLDRWNDSGHKVSIGCPRAIRDYFYGARSVDVVSQLHYAYLIGRKARRCWPRLAWWLLDMCILNALKLWSMGQGRVSQLDFREQLMLELTKQLPANQMPREGGCIYPSATALAKDHSSVLTAEERECKHCSHRPAFRKQTNYICCACNVHLCLGECFQAYHTRV